MSDSTTFPSDPNPSGVCGCGCGLPTRVFRYADRKNGYLAGYHARFINGHDKRRSEAAAYEGAVNPSGLCICGCGRKTSVSRVTNASRGHVAGQPMRYIKGHHLRKGSVDYVVDPDTGCWVWQRSLHSAGYGSQVDKTLAHRYHYEAAHGPIPLDLVLHHECGNKLCVNPDHLRPMTRADHNRLHRRAVIEEIPESAALIETRDGAYVRRVAQ